MRSIVPILALLALLGPPTALAGTAADDGAWTQLPLLKEQRGHTAIYDSSAQLMLVYGHLGHIWALNLGDDSGWVHIEVAGPGPSGRAEAGGIYDSMRERMLIFGGSNSTGVLNDVWAVSSSGTPQWTEVLASGDPPTGRHNAAVVYDRMRDRLLVFGGRLGDHTWTNDVWALSLSGVPQWTELAPSGIAPPAGADNGEYTAIYDPLRDRMLAYRDSGLGGTWSLALGPAPRWSVLSPAGPSPTQSYDYQAVYDSLRDRMVVVGEGNEGAWALSLGGPLAWTHLEPEGVPPYTEEHHTAIYDVANDRLVIFGGFGGFDDGVGNQTWELSLAGTPRWTDLHPLGTPASARWRHSATYDPLRKRMIVFGGKGSGHLNDVAAMSLGKGPTWVKIEPGGTPPTGRQYHSAIYDSNHDRLLIFGGHVAGNQLVNEIWSLTLGEQTEWTKIVPSGTPPPARWRHAAIYDPLRERMVLFGGGGWDGLDDTWALELAGAPKWTRLARAGATPPVEDGGFVAAYDPLRDRMLLFGAVDHDHLDETWGNLWSLSLSGESEWTVERPFGERPSHGHHYVGYYDRRRDRLVVYGGGCNIDINAAWALSLSGTLEWTRLDPAGPAPRGRDAPSGIHDPLRDRLILFSGYDYGRIHDLWELSFGEGSWTTTSPR